MKFFVFMCLITLNCFSQKIGKLDFSITEIDSLSKKESCLVIYDLGGKIISQKITNNTGKEIKTSGNGYFSIEPHFYSTDSLQFSGLTNKEKRKRKEYQYCKLRRVDYKSWVDYEDKSTDTIAATFYYDKDSLFYVRYDEKNANGMIENSTVQNFFYVAIETTLADNPDLKKWLENQNKDILKHCIENN